MKKIDIVVSLVTYNSNLDYINQLAKDLNKISSINIELIIADNLSDKNYFNKLNKINAKIISTGKNLGYGRANNLIEEISNDSEYFLVLNPDIKINKETITNLYQFMESNKNYHVLSPILISEDQKYFNFKRDKFNLTTLLYRWLFKIEDKFLELNFDTLDEVINVNYISGSFMFFRRETFKKINGFNKLFFMYFEDVEICDVINHNNYKIGILKKSTATHYRNRDSYKNIKLSLIHFVSFLKYKIFNRAKL